MIGVEKKGCLTAERPH